MFDAEKLAALKRGELQKIAKEHGVRANLRVCGTNIISCDHATSGLDALRQINTRKTANLLSICCFFVHSECGHH